MIEPLPNCFSICCSAAASALLLLSSTVFAAIVCPGFWFFPGASGQEARVTPWRLLPVIDTDYGIERSFDVIILTA
jgi:hypothetical protein